MVVSAPRLIRSWASAMALALFAASCSGHERPASASIPSEAEPVGAEALVTPELVAVADLQLGDELFRWPVGEDSVLVRVRVGEPTLLFGTSCDAVSAAPLPPGWQGVCLEYTDHGRRILGTFPYGTTSENGLLTVPDTQVALALGEGQVSTSFGFEAPDPATHAFDVLVVFPIGTDLRIHFETADGLTLQILRASSDSDCVTEAPDVRCLLHFPILESRQAGLWTGFVDKLSLSAAEASISITWMTAD